MSTERELRLPRRVVVTGGRGFIGAHLVRALEARGVEVESLDLRDGVDVCSIDQVLPRIAPGDTVVHLAAYADVYEAREQPVEAVRVNVLGTAVVVDAARRQRARLVLGSTACVYGNQPHYPTDEDTRPNPTEIYAQTKLAAEQVVKGFVDTYGLDAVIVRFPGVYGEGLRGALAIARFFEAASSGGVLEVHGDGAQTRTPLHVDDLVRGLVAIVERPDVTGVINLAGAEEVSALDLARRVVAIVGAGRIVHVAQREPQTLREVVDGSRARDLLRWEPRVSLDEGLRRLRRLWTESANSQRWRHEGGD